VRGDALQEPLEVGAGESPVERGGGGVVAVLEGQQVEKRLLDEMGASYEELMALLSPIDHEAMHELIAIVMDPIERLAKQRPG
jgi:hypothetical protein